MKVPWINFITDLHNPDLYLERAQLKKDQLICGICYHVIDDPIEFKHCGHVFCCKCVEKWIAEKSIQEDPIPNCPTCRAAIPYSIDDCTRSLYLKRKLDNTPVICVFSLPEAYPDSYLKDVPALAKSTAEAMAKTLSDAKDEKKENAHFCTWKGSYVDLSKHMKTCPYRMDECKLCGELVQFRMKSRHEKVECWYRSAPCICVKNKYKS